MTLAFKAESNRRGRLCIDFREINEIVVPESQPEWKNERHHNQDGKLPFLLNVRHKFSILVNTNEKRGPREDSLHYTKWAVAMELLFGLKISPAIFQRVLANTLRRNGLTEFCINYIDDVLVFSETFDQHKTYRAINEGYKTRRFPIKTGQM